SNSSSFPASQFIDNVKRPERVLNTHFYMPPDIRVVELMSCGKTDPGIIDFLMERFSR
ncbi:MAG: 3-hydroxybutyryl-CoA dehydrogenase, partial [Acidobacteriaceae bacterium]|nr:3-hydroxybutyryl-CoA dehydrogenase [Acidobacteriaceae bacterium]